jgi:ATP/maltotriose-dependent transcriptional regulator MalT
MSGAALDRGRDAYARSAWEDAAGALASADRAEALPGADLERLATCEYMLGRLDGYLATLEQAYRGHLDAGSPAQAVRCAFWIGVHLAQRGRPGAAGGWFSRAHRLLEGLGPGGAEAGYLLLPHVFRHEAAGDLEAAERTAGEAAEAGERAGDRDLRALAGHERGHLLIRLGRPDAGLALLDEAMLDVMEGALSPIASGIVYCGAILACQDAHELRRAHEWTAALTDWCARQPDLVAFTGRCLVHRAQLLRLHGAWGEALAEADRAVERCLRGENPSAAGSACYERGEIHRLRGEQRAAERAFTEASAHGWEPQPGLALLRLAQGRVDAARAAVERLRAEVTEPGPRAVILAAAVEVALAAGDEEAAGEAAGELEDLARGHSSGLLAAWCAQAQGALALARDEPRAALGPLRRAARGWLDLDAPYEAARARELVGRACAELGDAEAAARERGAARAAFARLGASADLARLGGPGADAHGLTARELEVLRLVAAGHSNRAIAERLVISEHTVARHVQNIFAKLRVASRTAASAYAFEHGMA